MTAVVLGLPDETGRKGLRRWQRYEERKSGVAKEKKDIKEDVENIEQRS